jgi:hypothetical protein
MNKLIFYKIVSKCIKIFIKFFIYIYQKKIKIIKIIKYIKNMI